MLARSIFGMLLLTSSCSLMRFFKDNPLQIQATVEGEIKGHKIQCQKTISLGDGKWGVMCAVGNALDVKYRVLPITKDQAHIEFMVSKSKEGKDKVLDTPSIMVSKSHSARTVSNTHYGTLMITAERIP